MPDLTREMTRAYVLHYDCEEDKCETDDPDKMIPWQLEEQHTEHSI